MLTTYRLLISLIFILAIAAPRLRSDVRTVLAIAFATGLVLVWHSGRGEASEVGGRMPWPVLVSISVLLAGGVLIAVWRTLDAAAASGP